MKHTVRDVIRVMEAWAPPGLAYDWDRIGLSLGRPDAQVRTILTALSITVDAARAAVLAKADMVVSHHPLIWDAIKAIRTDDPAREPLTLLVKADTNCFAAHTNLDVCAGGVNDVLAEALGLRETKPLFPVKHAGQVKLVTFVPEAHLAAVRAAVSAAGAGEIGDYTHCSFSMPGTGTFLPGRGATPFSGKKGAVNEEPEARFETLVPKALVPRVVEALLKAHPYEEVAYDLVPLANADPGGRHRARGHAGKAGVSEGLCRARAEGAGRGTCPRDGRPQAARVACGGDGRRGWRAGGRCPARRGCLCDGRREVP